MNYHPKCDETGDSQGGHRFVLEQSGEKMLIVVGLNPSTADAAHPDRTVGRIMGIAKGGGYDGFAVVNLSSVRAADKHALPAVLDERYHRRNMAAVEALARRYPSADVLVAFGDGVLSRPYLTRCFRDVCAALGTCKGNRLAIGALTAKGNPRHPLYAKYADGMRAFDVKKYLTKIQ